jgi:hypothetical protein
MLWRNVRPSSAGFLSASVTRSTRRGTGIDCTIAAGHRLNLQAVRDKGVCDEAILTCHSAGLDDGWNFLACCSIARLDDRFLEPQEV